MKSTSEVATLYQPKVNLAVMPRLFAWGILLVLLAAVPVKAMSWYSGAAVAPDGTVNGWGVTDAYQTGMYHVAYASTTLTSPNGRTASSGLWHAVTSVRVDVYLGWDANDLGNYLVSTFHAFYCYAAMRMIYLSGSSASTTVCPVPTNFRETGWGEPYDGVLEFSYAWDSSILGVEQLWPCQVGEYVTYPTSTDPWVWPKPPWNEDSPNPTVGWVPGTDGMFTDDHLTGIFLKPYTEANFSTTQKYRYRCTCKNGNSPVDIYGPYPISRSVTQKTDGNFKYTITKTGHTASVDPLP